LSGSNGVRTSEEPGEKGEKYLVIREEYVARDHPDAEYKYCGVFAA